MFCACYKCTVFYVFLQECIQMCICPEMLCGLLFTEALEDNEVFSVDGVMQVSRICDPRKKAILDKLEVPVMVKTIKIVTKYCKL